MKKIEFLAIEDFKVLKVIEIIGPNWNRFSGYLPYLRTFNPKEYDNKKGDLLDEKILETIKQYYPESFLRYNIEILFKEQLEENLKTLEGGSRKKIEIQFTPQIPFENYAVLASKEFYAYPREFEIRMLFGENKEKMELINTFFLCSIEYDKLDEIVKTVNPI